VDAEAAEVQKEANGRSVQVHNYCNPFPAVMKFISGPRSLIF